MEKQVILSDVKSWSIQCAIAGMSILFSILTAILGLESLNISGVMIFAVVCVSGCLIKDGVEFCKELVNEE